MINPKIERLEKKRCQLQAKRDKLNEQLYKIETQIKKIENEDDDCLLKIYKTTKSFWRMSDAKPGDILATTGGRKLVFIYKGMGTRSFCIGNPVVE